MGIVADEGLNQVLKKYFNEPRPDLGDTHTFTPTSTHLSLTPSSTDRHVSNELGMPSSHSQFMFFFAIFYVFSLLFRCEAKAQAIDLYLIVSLGKARSHFLRSFFSSWRHRSPDKLSRVINTIIRALSVSCVVVGAATVAFSRIYLGYHTIRQVHMDVFLYMCGRHQREKEKEGRKEEREREKK